MNSFKVALLQLLPTSSQYENMQKGIAACRKAKEMGADVALFPEMWNTGYTIAENTEELMSSSVDLTNEFVQSFATLAKELNMAIAITYLERHKPQPRNSMHLFDRFGKSVFCYAKVHTCDFGDESRLMHGDDFYAAPLDTEHGTVMVGAMICYDREFPESARILMLKGAEVVLVPNACPMEINRISQLRGRAYENMMGIATCNYPYGWPDCNGHSIAFDGIAYRLDGTGGRDTMILDAGEREGIFIADFPIDDMRAYRSEEVHGNAYRRPEKYKLLLDQDIKAPFIRDDRR